VYLLAPDLADATAIRRMVEIEMDEGPEETAFRR